MITKFTTGHVLHSVTPLPDSTFASHFVPYSRPESLQASRQSPTPPLHSVTPSVGCPSSSVASRFRLRLRGTLPHPRILLSFFPCIIDASRPPNKETPYLFLSRDHKAAAAAARELASESDWSLSAWSAFFQVHPKSAPGFRYRSTFVSRKLHPSRSVPPTPQRPEE